MSWELAALLLGLGALGLWLLSHVIEGLRPISKVPATLGWAPEIPINYVEVGGTKLRYIKSGGGPVVVLLHTLRTQLDLFEKVVPELSKRFTVYALDYPGHGYSTFPMPATMPPSSSKRWKASSTSSTCARSRWSASPSAA